MKLSHKTRISSTTTYISRNDKTTPTTHPKTIEIPINSSDKTPIPITVQLHDTKSTLAATKIQSSYRAHVIRTHLKKIRTVNNEANRLQLLIQRQETVDAIINDDRERLRLNEALMSLLLQLDSVPGLNPTVRELRRSVSRRIVGLQEILDAISEARVGNLEECLSNWEGMIGEIEGRVCEDRGGGKELERFCVEKLGFRCFERFLSGI
ncbi:hypothetical protein GIB67_013313 [Kingdonia uniflora]|uniref:BAG domain-containing protein n=1 Tax=Kingdonia uniflora TaxID=39325 RepID=A0A7J7LQY8_9MAGN|nr:hypothetical protein GIB67_013313 [Kingdonia uniflora]